MMTQEELRRKGTQGALRSQGILRDSVSRQGPVPRSSNYYPAAQKRCRKRQSSYQGQRKQLAKRSLTSKSYFEL